MTRASLAFGACFLAVAVGALALRLPRLAERPMHGDEANQAYKAGLKLFEEGVYLYDTGDHHGPSLYYLTQPILWLSGARIFAETTESEYRLLPVLFGLGLILLLIPLSDGLGRPATMVAGVLTALSPAMVYYSRYYIQETLLVFFTLATILAVWRYARSGRLGWLLLAGGCVGLMHATKETWVIHAAAMVGGVGLAWLWRRWRGTGRPFAVSPSPLEGEGRVRGDVVPSPLEGEGRVRGDVVGVPPAAPRARLNRVHVALAALVAVAVVFVLYSSPTLHGLANPRGPIDSVLAYYNYFFRAGGAGMHDHPWYWYLGMLVWSRDGEWPGWAKAWDLVSRGRLLSGVNWSEGLILALAAVGFVAALRRKPPSDAHAPLLRFFAFYTALLAILYSAIPYKTPWCLLTMLDGMIVLAGVGLVALVRWAPGRPVKITLGLAIAALLVQLGVQAWRTNTAYAADRRNPYVYAHTSTDCINLVKRVEAVAAASPRGRGLLIRVVADDYWPLPWYLRAFPNVGWGEAPDPPDADILILSPEAQDWADAHLRGKYVTLGAEGLRPEVFVSMYVEASLWDAFVKGNGRRAAP
jgi:uncharacterized protein (TIGR03663 family)